MENVHWESPKGSVPLSKQVEMDIEKIVKDLSFMGNWYGFKLDMYEELKIKYQDLINENKKLKDEISELKKGDE